MFILSRSEGPCPPHHIKLNRPRESKLYCPAARQNVHPFARRYDRPIRTDHQETICLRQRHDIS